MTTIIKMIVSIMSMMLKIAWRITKFLCGPMWDSVKRLCKSSWELYKQKKAQKAASAGGSAEGASLSKDKLDVRDSESSDGSEQS